MVRFIATDIDGTLVEAGSTNLNPEYFDVIRQLTAQGIGFAVASGRHPVSVRKTFAPVLDCIHIIALNGSLVEYQGADHAVDPIPTEWMREFWQDLGQYPEVDSIASCAALTYCPQAESAMHHIVRDDYGYRIEATKGWDDLPEETYSMVTIYHPEDAEKFINTTPFGEKWKKRLDLVPTGKPWVDCMMPGNNKGGALQYICRTLSIDPADTIAFGDYTNDIPMLQAAGCGYAVDNAAEQVKQIADRIIPGYASDGVLAVLKQLISDGNNGSERK